MKKVMVIAKVAAAALLVGTSGFVIAEGQTITDIAKTVTGEATAIAKLLSVAAYVAGVGFALAGVLQFKAHKENPTQIPIGTPIALLFVGAALIFVPTVFRVSGQTMFGSSGQVSTISGLTTFTK